MKTRISQLKTALIKLLKKPLLYVVLLLIIAIGVIGQDLYRTYTGGQRNIDNLVDVQLRLEGYASAASRATENEPAKVHDDELNKLTASSLEFRDKFFLLPWGRNTQKAVLECQLIGESAMTLARRDQEYRALLVDYEKARQKTLNAAAELDKTTEYTPYPQSRARAEALGVAGAEFTKVVEKINALYEKAKLGKGAIIHQAALYSWLIGIDQLIRAHHSLERGDEVSANV